MPALREHLADYLALRRALGFGLVRDGKLLDQFVGFCEQRDIDTVTTAAAIAWVTGVDHGGPGWLGRRWQVVRSFAIWLSGRDAACQIPPRGLFAGQPRRAVPYLYTDWEIGALMDATLVLRGPLRQATYRVLIGLLAVTGARVGELIAADDDQFDAEAGVLTVRANKGSGIRMLPLHPSTTAALEDYRRLRDRTVPRRCAALLVSPPSGSRLLYCNIANTFGLLLTRAGITPHSAACRPRIHDIRHTFAVNALTGWYRDGVDVDAAMPVLSTWLGHVHPKGTYWYLTGTPTLLTLVDQRLQEHLRAAS